MIDIIQKWWSSTVYDNSDLVTSVKTNNYDGLVVEINGGIKFKVEVQT